MKINPDEFQPEEKTHFDLSFTPEEKVKLIWYLLIFIAGLMFLLGLWKSILFTDHLQAFVNTTNVSPDTAATLMQSQL